MLKLAGGVLLLFSASVCGKNLCEKLRQRLSMVNALADLVTYIGENIETFRMPLPKIFETYENAYLAQIGFLSTARSDGLSAAIRNVKHILPPELYDRMCAFSSSIGGGYAPEQERLCSMTAVRLRQAGAEMQERQTEKIKMYRLLPLLTAASVLILIL